MTLLAADTFASNAHLIEACAQMGYFDGANTVVDPTYGKGNWWTRWRPDVLVYSDIKTHGVDFRHLPLHDNDVDGAAFDPPYVCKGGRSTSGMPGFDEAYGIDACPRTPDALMELICRGMNELDRVVRPGGMVLQKSQNYISSGALVAGEFNVLVKACDLGWELVDEIKHVAKHPRPQPAGRTQRHFRRNYSTLFVFRTGR